jgi:hypothetical protein
VITYRYITIFKEGDVYDELPKNPDQQPFFKWPRPVFPNPYFPGFIARRIAINLSDNRYI